MSLFVPPSGRHRNLRKSTKALASQRFQAGEWYQRAIDADPGDASYSIFLGGVRAKQGRLHEAAEIHRAATGCAEIVIEQPSGMRYKDAYRKLADELLDCDACAAVFYQDYTAIGLVMELLTRGVRVPADFAVTGFDDLPIGNSFALAVTTYTFPSEAVAMEALRVMQRRIDAPLAAPIKMLVPGELIVRDTSAATEVTKADGLVRSKGRLGARRGDEGRGR